MRSEEEVRELYTQYVKRHALAELDGKKHMALLYWGASVACGRTLGKDLLRIKKDIQIVKDYIRKSRQN